jgi:DNA-binding SARP family transcriptional activator
MMSFRILGPVSCGAVERDQFGYPPMLRGFLAALLLNAGQFVTRDQLAQMLWDDDPPASASENLRVYAMRLRRGLDAVHLADRVVTQRGFGYRLDVRPDELDSEVFARLHARGRAELHHGEPARAERTLHRALGLWRGPAGQDAPATSYLRARFHALNEQRMAAMEDAAEAGLLLGRGGRLVPYLSALRSAHPLRERLWELLIRARCVSGDWLGGLMEYDRLSKLLDAELGVSPSPRLQQLHQAILRHDESRLRCA